MRVIAEEPCKSNKKKIENSEKKELWRQLSGTEKVLFNDTIIKILRDKTLQSYRKILWDTDGSLPYAGQRSTTYRYSLAFCAPHPFT